MSLAKFWKILVVKVDEAWQQTSRYNCKSHGSRRRRENQVFTKTHVACPKQLCLTICSKRFSLIPGLTA
jgi:hypothetical protein